MSNPLFNGTTSIRHPRERVALLFTLLLALPIAYLIGRVIHETIGLPEVALFTVIAMLYVTFARGRLIGSSVMIHESQYPRVFAIVRRACAALEIPLPLIFVREDYNVPAAALGFGEPYALVISSNWIEHFEDDELAFIVGRQLGHIAAGHTRYLSLLSVNGNENPIIALIFGAWLRCCDYTCDKVGLLVCGSLDAATRAIAVSSFHHFGRHVNVAQFAEQGSEIAHDPVLRLGEWIGAEPYATNRIAAMRKFESSASFAALEEWFLRDVAAEPPALARSGVAHVTRADCAGWWRRSLAASIDLIVVGSLVIALSGKSGNATAPVIVNVDASPTPAASPIASPASKARHGRDRWTWHSNGATTESNDSDDSSDSDDAITHLGPFNVTYTGITVNSKNQLLNALVGYIGGFAALAIYLAVLVGLVGQSFGMMITGLRVVTTDFRPPGIWRSLWRYAVGWALWLPIVLISPVQRRVMLHDRLSGTRLIASERILARTASTMPAPSASG